ncbi:hypothetical protein MLOOGBEN_06710 [Bacillus sp. EB106-08-02-XG196]|uniref:hypothetical protein n=1 Tax=Bacillus sp. EB106-08-02-XG196 TaxID=2737049 RepID=UPI0015C473F2|nr:hypothetical protein [Bacillus sp. EB106-08-02-XG196]NWQ40389.1 hypothetical protein [Bacillus sp. EB106-08-02-XG196]
MKNDLNEVISIVNEHVTQLGQWVASQQTKCKSLDDVDAVFKRAESNSKLGLAKLDALNLPAETKKHVDFVRLIFKNQIAAFNYGTKRNYRKAITVAKQTAKLAKSFERRIKKNV